MTHLTAIPEATSAWLTRHRKLTASLFGLIAVALIVTLIVVG